MANKLPLLKEPITLTLRTVQDVMYMYCILRRGLGCERMRWLMRNGSYPGEGEGAERDSKARIEGHDGTLLNQYSIWNELQDGIAREELPDGVNEMGQLVDVEPPTHVNGYDVNYSSEGIRIDGNLVTLEQMQRMLDEVIAKEEEAESASA
jgi:hypothetical protein